MSEDVSEVAIETGAVPVALVVAAAPGRLLPEVACGRELDARVEKVVLSDDEIKLVLTAPSGTELLVVDVILKYEASIDDAVAVVVTGTGMSEGEPREGEEDSGDRVAFEVATGVAVGVGVKEVSEGAGEDGGDESID